MCNMHNKIRISNFNIQLYRVLREEICLKMDFFGWNLSDYVLRKTTKIGNFG